MNDNRVHPLQSLEKKIQPRDRSVYDVWFHWLCIAVAAVSICFLLVLLTSTLVLGLGAFESLGRPKVPLSEEVQAELMAKYDSDVEAGLDPELPVLEEDAPETFWEKTKRVANRMVGFVTHYPEPKAEAAGLGPAIWGTIWVCITCAFFALPIGVATAIFLEEFQPQNAWLRKFHSFVQLNINNLAGVPSVVYGILGLTLFVSMGGYLGTVKDPSMTIGVKYFDQFFSAGDRVLLIPIEDPSMEPTVVTKGMKALNGEGEWVEVNVVESRRQMPRDKAGREYALIEGRTSGRIEKPAWYHFRLPFGRSVLAGALTLMLVILPIVIISTQEALRGVPSSLREAGLGLGATPLQVIRNITLPAAIPGIMTGSILAMSRAIGEAAPILILAGAIFITSSPSSLMDNFTVMPLQIFDWTGRPQTEFHEVAASGIIILLAILFVFNSAAVLIRQYTQKRNA